VVRSRSRGWLGWIERVGNSLPDPVSLFLILIGLVMLFSALLAALGLEAVHPGTGEVIRVQNLFSAELLRRLFVEMPRTFAGFPPLGLVLVVMLGIGVADKSGLIAAALRGVLRRVPPRLLSAAVVFVGIMSSLAVDAGYVVVVPLGAFVFWAAGRHPLAGLAAAFAGVSGAFSANLFLTSLDPLLAGFTQSAAQLIDPDYRVPEVANYYLFHCRAHPGAYACGHGRNGMDRRAPAGILSGASGHSRSSRRARPGGATRAALGRCGPVGRAPAHRIAPLAPWRPASG
jgi:aminobenzoyl-glutamate transport protein